LIDEYPEGRFANPARIRLAQAAEARGDRAESTRWMQAVLETDPDSASRAQATDWLNAHAPATASAAAATGAEVLEPDPTGPTDGAVAEPDSDPGPEAAADPEPPAAGDASGDDAAGGAGARAVTEPDADEDPTPLSMPVPPDVAGGPFAVQIGAYLSTARANRMAERLSEAGFVSRVVQVPGSPLFRVRTGRYDELDVARAVAESVAAAGFATYIGDNVARERPVQPG
jgi:cell division protein FtsN